MTIILQYLEKVRFEEKCCQLLSSFSDFFFKYSTFFLDIIPLFLKRYCFFLEILSSFKCQHCFETPSQSITIFTTKQCKLSFELFQIFFQTRLQVNSQTLSQNTTTFLLVKTTVFTERFGNKKQSFLHYRTGNYYFFKFTGFLQRQNLLQAKYRVKLHRCVVELDVSIQKQTYELYRHGGFLQSRP